MVSLEDEIKQKDKEAAVLKANHKYEMLLNIELERVGKCKRAYESFHNFEVAVMKNRQNRILGKQHELNSLKTQRDCSKLEILDTHHGAGNQWSKTQSKERVNWHNISSNHEVNAPCVFDHQLKILERTNIFSRSQPECSSFNRVRQNDHSDIQRNQYAYHGVQYANHAAQYANHAAPHANEQTRTGSTHAETYKGKHLESARISRNRTSFTEDAIKLPVLPIVVPSSKTPSTTGCTSPANTVQRHTHFPENLTETHVISSRDVHTPWKISSEINNANFKKKSDRKSAGKDQLSPFDEYRLRLKESEQRPRKTKHQFTRAISAMESTGRRDKVDVNTMVRRTRSANMK